ncbi:MAG: helix-hairpin-helix domain-containing protein [Anaerolineae bacterium]|nr:helix-hairpin-helix domain-containing protein [Anaerolineae bacterium]
MNAEELGLIEKPPSAEEIRQQMRVQFRGYLIVTVVLSLITGGIIGRWAPDVSGEPDPARAMPAPQQNITCAPCNPGDAASLTPAQLQVYVSGGVTAPQVVALPEGSLVTDAIAAAGGLAAHADVEAFNLAAPLANHQHVIIPTHPIPNITQSPSIQPTPVGPEDKLDLNTATVEMLQTLPGIGETRATSIIEYRETHGNFATIADIQNVAGIGPAIFEKISPYIMVTP